MVDLAAVNAQARDIQFSRVVLTVIAGMLWGIGAGVYHAFRITWLIVAWSAAAVRLGWRDARASHQRRTKP